MASENRLLTQNRSTNAGKPLARLQAYLVESKVCVGLVRELLVEVKELVVVIALILFFVWGVIELFKRLHI
jgi:hypothetical protein